MTRRDYDLVAIIIAILPDDHDMRNIVSAHFADQFEKECSNFNRIKFLVACAYGKST